MWDSKQVWSLWTLLFIVIGCTLEDEIIHEHSLKIIPEQIARKSINPEEGKISDINLIIFDEDGDVEYRRYLSSRELSGTNGALSIDVKLLRGLKTSIFCCANIGYELTSVKSLKDLSECRYSLAYPDEIKMGIPMSAFVQKVWGMKEKEITLPLKRMMSKVSISLDRSQLDNDVRIYARKVIIGNCPRSVSIIGPSSALNSRDIFDLGFTRTGSELDALNRDAYSGVSEEISLYMLENMNGDLLDDTVDDSGKILNDSHAGVCSYIELHIEYISDSYHTKPSEYLKYRFYLGENNYNFDIERNCHYHYAIQFYGDGLGTTGWRLDKSALDERQ